MRTTSDYLTHLHIVGDRLLLGVIAGCLLLSLALAPWHQTFDAALLVGLPATIVPALLTWTRPGALVTDRKSTRLNSSHLARSRMPSSA